MKRIRKLFTGVILGGIGIAVMLNAWTFAPGIAFDTRSVLISTSGLFFSTLPTLVAAIITGAFRILQGGEGMWTGILVIATTGGIGVVWRHLRRQRLDTIGIWELYLFGLVVHLAMLLCMFTLPHGLALKVIAAIGLPVLAIYPLANVIIGSLIVRRQRRTQAQQRLRLLSSAVEQSSEGLAIVDLKGNLIFTNRAFAAMHGYTPEDLKGKNLSIFHTPEQLPAVEAANRQIQQSGEFEGEIWHVRRDGTVFPTWMHNSLLRNERGDPIGMIGTMRDITDLKEAEAAIREQEEKYRNLVEQSLEGIVIAVGPPPRLVFVNTAFAQMLGYSKEELLAMETEELYGLVHPDDRGLFFGRFSERIAGKNPPSRYQFRGIRKDQKTIWLEISSTLITYQGRPAVQATFVDITERKEAEEELRRYREDLEELVRLRTEELESFSYSVSHDLRAPLRAIDGFARVLLEDYAERLDEEGTRIINVIRSNTQQMGQLIDDLLAFSRLGRQALNISELDMESLARSVIKELRAGLSKRKVLFKVKGLPPAYGDAVMIRQVLFNLLSNAVKFTRPCSRAEIELDSTQTEEENIYYVRDNGVGFDMKYTDKLFGVFQRLHSAAEFEGTGVGLAIVKRIIQRHGGRVWAEGKVGQGAAFYFTLPRGRFYVNNRGSGDIVGGG